MRDIRPWFSEDIAALIKSVLFLTKESTSQEYKRGFLACAMAISMAANIDLNDIRFPKLTETDQNKKE